MGPQNPHMQINKSYPEIFMTPLTIAVTIIFFWRLLWNLVTYTAALDSARKLDALIPRLIVLLIV